MFIQDRHCSKAYSLKVRDEMRELRQKILSSVGNCFTAI